ncbi:Cytochrome P450 [Rhypophila sp. PSN 637]
MTSSTSTVLLAIAAVFLSWAYTRLRFIRFRQYAHFPQYPSSLILGHLGAFGDLTKRNDKLRPGAHADLSFVEMHREMGRPPLMFVDMRPIADPVVVVGNYDVAEQITRTSDTFPTSPPKSEKSTTRLVHLTGPTSILAQHGDYWKMLRRRFNPGFSSQYLTTFIPEIFDKGLLFLDRLDALSRSADEFSLLHLTTRLTFDVIGKVVMEVDLHAQQPSSSTPRPGTTTSADDLVTLYESLLDAYAGEHLNLPWWLNYRTVRRRARRADKITSILRDIVRERHATSTSSSGTFSGSAAAATAGGKSVLSLSLRETPPTLPDTILDETVDQLRTFLFAGHDTTSILLSWTIYELARHPDALSRVRSELDSAFGTGDDDAIRSKLVSAGGGDVLAKLPYLNAVIKETLRVHPPGGSARVIPPGSNFTVSVGVPSDTKSFGEQSKTVLLDGLLVYMCQSIIHTDKNVFGEDAEYFVPERWLDSDSDSAEGGGKGGSSFPAGSWRPFERGPRNCIGQELANIEARVILAMVLRRYDFVKVGLGGFVTDPETGEAVLDENGVGGRRYKVPEGRELYVTRKVTSKPIDGMMVKVKLIQ